MCHISERNSGNSEWSKVSEYMTPCFQDKGLHPENKKKGVIVRKDDEVIML